MVLPKSLVGQWELEEEKTVAPGRLSRLRWGRGAATHSSDMRWSWTRVCPPQAGVHTRARTQHTHTHTHINTNTQSSTHNKHPLTPPPRWYGTKKCPNLRELARYDLVITTTNTTSLNAATLK